MDTGIVIGNTKRKRGIANHQQGNNQANIKKNECKPWLKKMWCITSITQEYRDRMYRLLDLYGEEYDERYPVVCMDEKSKQLIEDVRGNFPLKPASVAKYDHEYRRNGTRNIFVAVEPLADRREIIVTSSRMKKDFAYFVKGLLEQNYKEVKTMRLVLDNLNTHFASSFYETFTKTEARKILSKIEFYYTPKHGSWLNMAEIEINIMDKECLNRRIGQEDELKSEISHWVNQRNKAKKRINWSFTKKDADMKLSKHYVHN